MKKKRKVHVKTKGSIRRNVQKRKVNKDNSNNNVIIQRRG